MSGSLSKKLPAKCLAVFGTGSDVGKSIVATALCRHFMRLGYRTVPFKAQNMSNNSGVTPDGLEMGRAQIVQAEAAGVVPHVDMNPVLLKPTSEVGSQVVLFGKVLENSTAMEYHLKKAFLFKRVTGALDRLRAENDIVVIEGAGSCAEVNLMPHDIVNFKIAEYADAQVLLVADIHRGGVFAQVVGTLECLPEDCRDRVAGILINRFRGDIGLFRDGETWISENTGRPVYGTLPWFEHFSIEPEDSVVIEAVSGTINNEGRKPVIGIIRLPHISNFNDFNPLMALDGLDSVFISNPSLTEKTDALIIPGSKNTGHDLEWLKKSGWADAVVRFADNGGPVTGICGGYQMLGISLDDPDGCEGVPGISEGLNLLPVKTRMMTEKTTTLSRFSWGDVCGTGYEIHMGETRRIGGSPLFRITGRNQAASSVEDGCISDGQNVMGTYLHGLFDTGDVLEKWLAWAGLGNVSVPELNGLSAREKNYDMLLEHFRKYIDVDGLQSLL